MLKSFKFKLLAGVTVVASLAVMAGACNGSSNNPTNNPVAPASISTTNYIANMTAVPLNTQFATDPANPPTAVTTVTSANGTFTVNVTGTGFNPGITQYAFIYSGTQCPTAASDTNGDGVIDVVEALASAGGILIPLNGTLSDRNSGDLNSGDLNYPLSDANGDIAYSQTGNLAAMLAGLGTIPSASPSVSPTVSASPSASPTASPSVTASASPSASPSVTASASPAPVPTTLSGLFAINNTGNLDLTNLVVMIHGISDSVFLPATVQGAGGLTANESLPVACGNFIQGTAPAPTVSPSASPSASPSVTPSTSPSPSVTPSPSVSPSPTI